MLNINKSDGVCNGNAPDIVQTWIRRTVANLDTLELWVRFLPSGIRKLDRLVGKRVRIKQCKVGFTLCLNQPTREVLEYLIEMTDRQRANEPKSAWLHVQRVDIGVDFITAELEYANELQWHLERHLLLKWKRSIGVRDERGTSYWNGANSPRNLVAYSDKPSRMTVAGDPCCRLELRMKRVALKRENLVVLSTLMAINPQQLFQRHLKWVEFNEDAEQTLVDSHARKHAIDHEGLSETKSMWNERSYLFNRYRELIRRSQLILSHRRNRTSQGILALIPSNIMLNEMH